METPSGLSVLKIPYEGLLRWDENGVFRGAHHQFREVILTADNTVISEKLLPAVPWGSDPDFPAPSLISLALNDALAESSLRAAAQSAAELAKDAAVSERDAAIAERDAALAQIETLTAQISALTAQPPRPPGKWWPHAAAFLEEFTPDELFAVHTSQVPLVVQLLMTLLAWTGEVWSADSRISMGLQALVSLQILTPERRAAILAE